MKAWRRTSTQGRVVSQDSCQYPATDVVLSDVDGDLVVDWAFSGSEVGLDHWDVVYALCGGDPDAPVGEEFPAPASRQQTFPTPGAGNYQAWVRAVPEVGDPCDWVPSNCVEIA